MLRSTRHGLSHGLAGLTTALMLVVPARVAPAQPVCPAPVFASGLDRPQAIAQSPLGNLLVSESGTPTPNSGRISVVNLAGERQTLLAGLPSGLSDVGDPAGPAGLFIRGRTLYVAIGIGDAILAGPIPGTALANPNPSSPIFSSVLAIHFNAHVERTTAGFTLSPDDQQALAAGERVMLSNGGGDRIAIELIANFPDYVSEPRPQLPENVRGSNPFDLVVVGERIYVTDGGRNLVWEVDRQSGDAMALATFPVIPNPLAVGPPVVEAVPTGIAYAGGQLLVTLFRGAPFPPETSVVERIDIETGAHAPVVTGLKTAIDVIPIKTGRQYEYLVLQHSSGAMPFFDGPGLVLWFEDPSAPPAVVANCLERPTSMVLDEKTGTLYVTELAGRVVAIPVW